MRKLYSNVGKKVQALAKFGGIVGIVSIVLGIILLFVETVAGVALGVLGLILVLGSLPMYAFGQITEDVHEMRNCANGTTNKIVNDLPEL